MQKAESLSFQMVIGLEGRGQSLVNEISIRTKALRLWFLRNYYVIWNLKPFFEITNLLTIPTLLSSELKTISQYDELWFVGVYVVMSCDLLGRNVLYIDAYTMFQKKTGAYFHILILRETLLLPPLSPLLPSPLPPQATTAAALAAATASSPFKKQKGVPKKHTPHKKRLSLKNLFADVCPWNDKFTVGQNLIF